MCAERTQSTPATIAPALQTPASLDLDFRLLFEASPDVLLVLLPDSPRFTIMAATEARLRVTHTTRDQYGRGLFEVFPDNPDDPAADGTNNLRASLERVLATRAADTMAVQKYDIRGPDGSFQARYWSPKNIPVPGPDGDVSYILHRVEDVTELVQAGERHERLQDHLAGAEREVVQRSRELSQANAELRAANARLGEVNTAKTDFFNNVSHEFRTPLTLMLGPLEQALGDTVNPLPGAHRQRVEMAVNNGLRLLKLVNTLLDFARLEGGRLRGAFAPVELARITSESAQMFQSACQQAGLALLIDCPPLAEPPWIDAEMWRQIVPNLISNAFKHTHAGSITVRLFEHGERVVLEVEDTGVGIPAAELPRIFERFHRIAGQHARTHEGTGIGLALVRELVRLHVGEVEVASQVGSGSCFRVALPKGNAHLPTAALAQDQGFLDDTRVAAAHALEAARWTTPAEMPAEGDLQAGLDERPRVLVVDDNADLRAYISSLLAPAYRVQTAVDGLDGLAKVREQRPDIVVSDVMMPRLDGLGLLRALRADAATATLPVVLVSARSGQEATIEGLDSGCDDYLIKPFTGAELLARVRTHVGLARIRRQQTDTLEARVLERTGELALSNQRLQEELALRTRIEQQLRAALVQLERNQKDLQGFIYIATHDLMEPLRKLRAFSDRLDHTLGADVDATGRDYLVRIQAAAERMDALIDDLLAVTRIATSTDLPALTDLGQVVRNVLHELEPDLERSGARVELGALPMVLADAAQMRILFRQLIENALKFQRPEVAPCVSLRARREADSCVIEIADNGIGFDEIYLERMFTIFQRLHPRGGYSGTGVGLTLVRKIAERHGGQVTARSRLGQGSTFVVTLPLVGAAMAAIF